MNRWVKRIIYYLLFIFDISSASPTGMPGDSQEEKGLEFENKFTDGKFNFPNEIVQQTINTQNSKGQLENDQPILRENAKCDCSFGAHMQDKYENEDQNNYMNSQPTYSNLIVGNIQSNIITDEKAPCDCESSLNSEKEMKAIIEIPIASLSISPSNDVKEYKRCTHSENILKTATKHIETGNVALSYPPTLENVSCCSALKRVLLNMLNLQEECPCSKQIRTPQIIEKAESSEKRMALQPYQPILNEQQGGSISEATNKGKESVSSPSWNENPSFGQNVSGSPHFELTNNKKIIQTVSLNDEYPGNEPLQEELWTTLNGIDDILREESIISPITDGKTKPFLRDRVYENQSQLTVEKNQSDKVIAMSSSTPDRSLFNLSVPYSEDTKKSLEDTIIETIPNDFMSNIEASTGDSIIFNESKKIENVLNTSTETDAKYNTVKDQAVGLYNIRENNQNKLYANENNVNILTDLLKSNETNNDSSRTVVYDDIDMLVNSSDMSNESTTEYLLIINDKSTDDYSLSEDDRDIIQRESKPKLWLSWNQNINTIKAETDINDSSEVSTEGNIQLREPWRYGLENLNKDLFDALTDSPLNEFKSTKTPEYLRQENSMTINSHDSNGKSVIKAFAQELLPNNDPVHNLPVMKSSDSMLSMIMSEKSIESNETNNSNLFQVGREQFNTVLGESYHSDTKYEPSKFQDERMNVDGAATVVEPISMESQTPSSIILIEKSNLNLLENSDNTKSNDPPTDNKPTILGQSFNNHLQSNNLETGTSNLLGRNNNESYPIEPVGLLLPSDFLLDNKPVDHLQPNNLQDGAFNILGTNNNTSSPIEKSLHESRVLPSDFLFYNSLILNHPQPNKSQEGIFDTLGTNNNISNPIEKSVHKSGALSSGSLTNSTPIIDNNLQSNKSKEDKFNTLGHNNNIVNPTRVNESGSLTSDYLIDNKTIVSEKSFNGHLQPNEPQYGIFDMLEMNNNSVISKAIEASEDESETFSSDTVIGNNPIILGQNLSSNLQSNDSLLSIIGQQNYKPNSFEVIEGETGTFPTDRESTLIPKTDKYIEIETTWKPERSTELFGSVINFEDKNKTGIIPIDDIISTELLLTNMDYMNDTLHEKSTEFDLEMKRADDILENVINSFKKQLRLDIFPNDSVTAGETDLPLLRGYITYLDNITDSSAFHAIEDDGNEGIDVNKYTETYKTVFNQEKDHLNIELNTTGHNINKHNQVVSNHIIDTNKFNTAPTNKNTVITANEDLSTVNYDVLKSMDEVNENLAQVHYNENLSTERIFFTSGSQEESESSLVTFSPNYNEQKSTSDSSASLGQFVSTFTTDKSFQPPVAYTPEPALNLLGLTENLKLEPNETDQSLFNSFLEGAIMNSNGNDEPNEGQDILKSQTNFHPSFSEPSTGNFNSTDLEEEILSTGDYMVHNFSVLEYQNLTDLNESTTQISPSHFESNDDSLLEYRKPTLSNDSLNGEKTTPYKYEKEDTIHDYLFSNFSQANSTSESGNLLSMKTTISSIDNDDVNFDPMKTTDQPFTDYKSTTHSSVLLCLPEQFSEGQFNNKDFPTGRFFVQNDMNIIELELVHKNVSQCTSLNNLYEFKPKSHVSSTDMDFIKSLEGQHVSQILKRTHQKINMAPFEMTSKREYFQNIPRETETNIMNNKTVKSIMQPKIREGIDVHVDKKFGMERNKIYSSRQRNSQDPRNFYSGIHENVKDAENSQTISISSHEKSSDIQMNRSRSKDVPRRLNVNFRNRGRSKKPLNSRNPIKIDKDILKRFMSVYNARNYFNKS